MLGPTVRNSGWTCQVRQVGCRRFGGNPSSPLDITDRLQVLLELAPVARTETPIEIPHTFGHAVEDARVVGDAGRLGGWIHLIAIAEKALEDQPRIAFHGQWCCSVLEA